MYLSVATAALQGDRPQWVSAIQVHIELARRSRHRGLDPGAQRRRQRLLLSTVLLATLLVTLGILIAADVLDAAGFEDVTVLRDAGTYTTIALLGMLGALLSFSIGAMASGADRRIYELASGRFAATAARILVGAAAAVVVVATAVQSGVVGLNGEWLPMLAVAAGFSERLVKRIIESLSADAEKPRSTSSRVAKDDADPPGT
ncbi:MAG: hypothetical protein HY830_02765 [Actinobacteria bacterium]|nr:hypothetical protein [Actinomycetota bacterium]